MHYVFGFLGLFALSLMVSLGCSEGGGSTGQVFPCTEQGIRDAIAEGGGPHRFDCDGPTTIVTSADIVIDNDVTLDGEGNLTVDGNSEHRLFSIPEGATVELRGFGVTNGYELIFGGGIRNEGTLTLTDSTVSDNANASGASSSSGVYTAGTLAVVNSTVSGNDHSGISASAGTVTVTDSAVSGNAEGIRLNGGTLKVTNSTVSENGRDGLLSFSTVTVTGSTVSDNGGTGISAYGEAATVTDSTVSGNGGAGISGGGTVTDSTVSGNGGAGISGGGTVTNSTVSDNNGYGISGGGTVTNSTVSDNGSTGITNVQGTLTLTNSTVSGNSASTWLPELGPVSGILNVGTAVLTNSTVSGKDGEDAATIANAEICPMGQCFAGALTLRNTLVDGECVIYANATATSLGYNLESPDDTCGFDPDGTDLVNVTAEQLNLGPLQDNGGPTMTHGLGAGSVAIDAIPEEDCVDAEGQPLTTDQRGEPRPAGSGCDVGAFEAQP